MQNFSLPVLKHALSRWSLGMPGVTVHFLLVFSYGRGELESLEQFDDSDAAFSAYAKKEAQYRNRLDKFEVVLLGADSEDTIRKTHAHYFVSTAHQTMSSPFSGSDLLPSLV